MEGTEIRKQTSPLMAKLIAAVREHARAHYAEGWDPIVEAYSDEDLIPVIGYCRTVEGAIKAVAKGLDLRAEVRHDVRASSGEYDDVPPPAPVPTTMSPETEAAWRNDEVLAAEGKPEQAELAAARAAREGALRPTAQMIAAEIADYGDEPPAGGGFGTAAAANTLAVAEAVLAGTAPIEDLTAAMFPDGVAAGLAQMESEGRIVDMSEPVAKRPRTRKPAGETRRKPRKAAEPERCGVCGEVLQKRRGQYVDEVGEFWNVETQSGVVAHSQCGIDAGMQLA